MNNKEISIIVSVWLIVMAQFCWASPNDKVNSTQKDSDIQIYLPREITVKDDTISLGCISIIRGKESVVAKASALALGRIASPGQEIIIDRTTLLSRLACNGIPASKVTLTGAEKITVKQQQQIITGNKFVELANSFLKKNPPDDSICQWNPMRIPKDLIVPMMSKDIRLRPRLARSSIRNQAKVQITVFASGKEAGTRKVTFRLKYNCRKVVTQVEIPRGSLISQENVKIEKAISNYPEPANWTPPYGLVAKCRLPANTVIRPNMVGPVKPQVLLKRNQNVVIRIDRVGLLVTAIGRTMQDGRAGEYIKVRNVDSRRIVLARVNEDGTVEPVF